MNSAEHRLTIVAAVLCLGGLLVVVRLFNVQIINGRTFAAESRRQTNQRAVLTAHRGRILDRNGIMLASSAVGSSVNAVVRAAASSKNTTAPGAGRAYQHGTLAGNVLGCVGADGYGSSGVELCFDSLLRGHDGWSILQKNGLNKRYLRIDMPQKSPVDGADIYLTLDVNVQKIVETVLHQTVRDLAAAGGMCIVMDPLSGDILAMANEPGFDPNHASDYSLQQRLNRCISNNYEPGSTFKLITAASAIQKGVIRESDTVDGNMGVYEIYTEKIRDRMPFGKMTFADALRVSSNVCFARVADKLGSEALYRSARDFGLGARTGIELPGEECGIVHPLNKWSGRTRVTMAIGQEISATLLQMTLAFGAIANDGVLINPRIISRVVSGNTGDISCPVAAARQVRRVVTRDTARRLRAMLAGVVESGTGREAALAQVSVAGKTGTSQKVDEQTGEYSLMKVYASFIGFLPAENPVLLCAVVIDEPEGGLGGGSAAAPAFRKVITQIISHQDLDFAEHILRRSPSVDPQRFCDTLRRLPDVCGMTTGKASIVLTARTIDFEIVGNGGKVIQQSLKAGEVYNGSEKLLVYTGDKSRLTGVRIAMPDCVGWDLRDAINALSVKGLTPCVIGAGTVSRQYPLAGLLVEPAKSCSLYCAFEG